MELTSVASLVGSPGLRKLRSSVSVTLGIARPRVTLTISDGALGGQERGVALRPLSLVGGADLDVLCREICRVQNQARGSLAELLVTLRPHLGSTSSLPPCPGQLRTPSGDVAPVAVCPEAGQQG